MLLINVHQLDVILAQSVRLAALEDQVDHIRSIFSLEGEDIFILRGAEDLRQGVEVDAKGNVAVTSVGGEHFGFEHHRDEGDVGVVHGLESHARVIAVEVTILDEIFDGIDDLLQTSELFSIYRGEFAPSSGWPPALNVLPALDRKSVV